MKSTTHHLHVTMHLARLAGFPPDRAARIAGAAQYVDMANDHEYIRFRSGQTMRALATANELYASFTDSEDNASWVPFHFFPGDRGDALGQRLICRPLWDSPPLQDLVFSITGQKFLKENDYLIGIILHVLFDSVAHHGFSGVFDEAVNAPEIRGDDGLLGKFLGRAAHAVPLGHLAVGELADLAHGEFTIVNEYETIERNNKIDFLKIFRTCAGLLLEISPQPHEPMIDTAIKDMFGLFLEDRDDEETSNAMRDYHAEKYPDVVYPQTENWISQIGTKDLDGFYPGIETDELKKTDYWGFHAAARLARHVAVDVVLPHRGILQG